jgi:putative oxidoreductase
MLNGFLSLGRWFFAIPFSLFGLIHYMKVSVLAQAVPNYMPAKEFWVYFTGTCLIAASVSMLLGKWDKLATTLLAVFLLLTVFLMHVPGAMANDGNSANALTSILKDISLAGGCLMYAKHYAQDKQTKFL